LCDCSCRNCADLIDVPRMRDAVVKWKDSGEMDMRTFALIPDGWGNDTKNHPFDDFDDEVFYWLTPEEWLEFGIGFQNEDWKVIDTVQL